MTGERLHRLHPDGIGLCLDVRCVAFFFSKIAFECQRVASQQDKLVF